MTKFVYNFGGDNTQGDASMRNLLGGKGANLAEMASLGLPVPAGFTITTDLCTTYYKNDKQYPTPLKAEVASAMKTMEQAQDAVFGDADNPLLVSVRSGARISMPGMMDTVLNLGLNTDTVKAMILLTGNERMVLDSYRRFIQMFGDIVLGIKMDLFNDQLELVKKSAGIIHDPDLSCSDLTQLISRYKTVVLAETGEAFPEDPEEQMWDAVAAVSFLNNYSVSLKYADYNADADSSTTDTEKLWFTLGAKF